MLSEICQSEKHKIQNFTLVEFKKQNKRTKKKKEIKKKNPTPLTIENKQMVPRGKVKQGHEGNR